MNRFFEGVKSIGRLYPTTIKIQANPQSAFLDVQKSFSATADNLNKAIIQYGKNNKRETASR